MDDMEQQRPERPEQHGSSAPESRPEPPERPEPASLIQLEYLRHLCEEAGEPVVEVASQAEACRRLRELQHKVGRRPRILVDEQTDG